MALTTAQIDLIADAAWFFIAVEPRSIDTTGVGLTKYYGAGFTVSGEGTPALERVLRMMWQYPRGVFTIDVGSAGYQRMVAVTSDDVMMLHAAFYARYGGQIKPPVYGNPIFNDGWTANAWDFSEGPSVAVSSVFDFEAGDSYTDYSVSIIDMEQGDS